MINKENYSIYSIDYLDGRLSEEKALALFAFFDQHPELKAEFEGLADIKLTPPSNILYSDKQFLKKPILAYKEINKSNYEVFFLDFHEGNLSDENKNDVLAFIEQNPVLKIEFHSFKSISLEPNEHTFILDKEKLEIDELKNNPVLESMIAAIEGDLNYASTKKLEQQIELNPSLNKEYALLKKTFLKADTAITFNGKTALKHYSIDATSGKREIYHWAVAASVLLLLGVGTYLYFVNDKNLDQPQIANNDSKLELKKDSILPVDSKKVEKSVENKTNKIFTKAGIINKKIETIEKTDIVVKGIETVQNTIAPVLADSGIQLLNHKLEPQLANVAVVSNPNIAPPQIKNIAIQQSTSVQPSSKDGYLTLASITQRMLYKNIKDPEIIEELERLPKSQKMFSQFASIGLKVIGKITGGKLKYENCYNEDGEMIAYNVSIGNVQLSKNSCK